MQVSVTLIDTSTARITIIETMAPYPTKEEIREIASSLGTTDQSPFFDRVSPNVVWDVMGM